MAVYKNVASQYVVIYAHDTVADAPKTGDGANITAEISKDTAAGVATNDVNPTEIDATGMKGVYAFLLTQAETNADLVALSAVSSTADVSIEPVIIYTLPGSSAGLFSAVQSIAANAINAASIATGALSIAKFAADIGTTAYASNPIGQAICERLLSAMTTAGSLGKKISDSVLQTGDSFARIGATGSGLTSLATAATQTTLANRIGAWTGSGVNTVLGAFKALLSKTATLPTDIGGTFTPTTDSTEAIRDRGDAAWITGGGGTGLTAQETADAVNNLAPGATAATGSIKDRILNLAAYNLGNMPYRAGGEGLLFPVAMDDTTTLTTTANPTGDATIEVEMYYINPDTEVGTWDYLKEGDMFLVNSSGPSAAEWVGQISGDVLFVKCTPGTGTIPACVLTLNIEGTLNDTLEIDIPEVTGNYNFFIGPNGEHRNSFQNPTRSASPQRRLSAARADNLDELASANMPADLDTLLTRATEARLAELDAANLPADVDGLTAAVAALPAVADIWSHVIDGTVTAEQVLVAALAFAAGETTGGDTVTVTFKRQDGTTAAITMTVDEDGNRSAVVTVLS